MRREKIFTVGVFREKRVLCRSVGALSAGLFLFISATPAFAAGTDILGGNAVLTGMARASLDSNGANAAAFSSSAASAVLDWAKFNVGAGQSMSFNGASTTFFNLVDGAAGKSQIDGIINGSGNVWVINPAGIAFGAGSSVNVGGLFAAAAGNLANEAKIRSGESTDPVFGSFGGIVEVQGGEFLAKNAAFLGQGVAVQGDFRGADGLMTVGSSGPVAVDVVAGGAVAVEVAEFVEQGTSVILGDLLAGGEVDVAGSGDVLSLGAVDANGSVSIMAGRDVAFAAPLASEGGSVDVTSLNGDIGVANGVGVGALGRVSLQAVDGDVVVNGAVVGVQGPAIVGAGAALDDGGSIVRTGSGNVTIGTDAQVLSGNQVILFSGDAGNGRGGIEVGGTVKGNSQTFLRATGGDIHVTEGAVVSSARSVTIDAASYGTEDKPVSGVAQIDGNIVSDGDIAIWSAVSGSKKQGSDTVNVTYHEFGSGSVKVGATGSVSAKGRLDILSGTGEDHGIEIGGAISAEEVYAMSLGDKGLSVVPNASVDGKSLTQLGTTYGDLTVAEGATIRASGAGGDVVLSAGDIKDGHGSLIVSGTVENSAPTIVDADGNVIKRTSISLQAATHSGSQGDVIINEGAFVVATGGKALVQVSTGMRGGYDSSDPNRTVERVDGEDRIRETRGDVKIYGNVGATGAGSQVFVWSGYGDKSNGDVTIGGNAQVGNGGANGEVKIWSARGKDSTGNLTVEKGAQVYSDGVNGHAYLFAAYGDGSQGDLTMNGNLHARGAGGRAEASAGHGDGAIGNLFLGGMIDAYTRAYLAVAYGPKSEGRLEVSETGRLCSGGYLGPNDEIYYNGSEENYAYVVCGLGEYSKSSALLSGGIVALGGHGCTHVEGARGLGAYCDLTIADSGEVVGRDLVDVRTWNGDVNLDGTIGAIAGESCRASLIALSDDGSSGNITFGENGGIVSDDKASIYAQGDIRQPGSVVRSAHGYSEQVDLRPAVQANIINVRSFGDVGDGKNGESLSVSGNVRAIVDGDASLAAANGEDFRGGGTGAPNVESLNEAQIKADTTMEPMVVRSGEAFPEETHADNRLRTAETVNDISTAFSDLGTGMFKTGGSLSIYTAGKLEPNGLFSAGGDLTLSAATFGNIGNMSSYFQAGGKLTVNNVGKAAHPQIAYFESVNGKEPKISNLPNDTVIFVDGRLAGGNLQIINTFGATEAFPVDTPELKSEQGIFGNPVFMHGDLDVANPMAVGNVDYMLQEIPRLTLASDFPLEIDKSVNTAGLNPKDVYRFGQHPQVADEKPQTEPEKKDDKASAEQSAEPKLAYVR